MNTHILLVTFPGQGHINPCLQLAKRLIKLGVKVTFMTCSSAITRMPKHDLIDFLSFSDGYENAWSAGRSYNDYMASVKAHGSKALEDVITAKRAEGSPFSHIIYTLLVPWAGQVAYALQAPATLLWIQPATVFDVYFYYFNGYFREFVGETGVIELPGLPTFERNDLPSYVLSSNPNIYDFALPLLRDNFELLDHEETPTILVNTFDALEHEPLKAVVKYKLTPIGPLIPSACFDANDQSDSSFGGDLIQKSVEYIEWLDSQGDSSVIYIAFGSYCKISNSQMEEVAKGLMKTLRPFLWVIRGSEKRETLDEMALSCQEELEKQGKIVPWCNQVEVLSHPSVGCFVTHCGWNSSLESIVSGIPVVGLPQWSDQATNAKLMQDFWKVGKIAIRSGDGEVVEAEEIERCLESVMVGERGKEMRKQGLKWRDLAKEALKEDGSSNVNLREFLENVLVD